MRITLALLALAACGVPDPVTDQIADDLTTTPCATLPSDVDFVVPETFTSKTLASPSGEYGYLRDSAPSTCEGYIVDVWMTTTSNLNPDPKGVPSNPTGRLAVDAGPYDLPGSMGANGTTPTTKNDCTRLSEALYVYEWPHTDTGYTYVGGALYGGTWSDGACFIGQTSAPFKIPQPHASASGVDRYRFVIGVIERTTYQEAAAVLSQLPPS